MSVLLLWRLDIFCMGYPKDQLVAELFLVDMARIGW
jgi:hypothetical protein